MISTEQPHETAIERESVAHIGRRWRFVCRTCDTRGPLASLEQAELARDRHLWELHQEKKAEEDG